MVIWLTGISGTGKTTLGKFYLKTLKKNKTKCIYLDGDSFRSIFNDLGYSIKDRNINAYRLTRLVKYLSKQKLNLIVAANLTSFKYRSWCRNNIEDYLEIYISSELNSLLKRDYKKLYIKSMNKKLKNVIGVDIIFKKPKGCDLYFENNGSKKNFLKNFKIINEKIKKKKLKIF